MQLDTRTINDYRWLGDLLTPLLVKEVSANFSAQEFRELFEANPKLVVAWNHGPVMGPLAPIFAVISRSQEWNITGRRHFGVTWKGFYHVPALRDLARYITQTDGVYDAAGYAKLLREGPYNDFMVAPEGDNCNFGDGSTIQPFVSHGFVEIAIRAEVPILIMAHRGTEQWAKEFSLPDAAVDGLRQILPQRHVPLLESARKLAFSAPFGGKLRKLRFAHRLYQSKLKSEELAAERHERKGQLEADGEAVRRIMQELVDGLAAEERA